jgi:transposase-like protein
MHRIVASFTTLDEHIAAVATRPDAYRPRLCPHCRAGGLWGHGCFQRKADRTTSALSRNPVPVPRFLCVACRRTCSRLPLAIAPRRWYDWTVQQTVLGMLWVGWSTRTCSRTLGRARRTVGRWRDWLRARSSEFAACLCSRDPELGRWPDTAALWRHVIDAWPLARAMAVLDRELAVP